MAPRTPRRDRTVPPETAPPTDADASLPDAPAEAESASAEAAWSDNLPWSPRNMLVPYLLLALSAYEAHGYWLQSYLRGLGFLTTNITTIYRTLRQLERQGLVSSYWQPTDEGPARRMYALTDAGRATLGAWAGALEGYRGMIDSFFRLYGLSGPPVPPASGQPAPLPGAPDDDDKEDRA